MIFHFLLSIPYTDEMSIYFDGHKSGGAMKKSMLLAILALFSACSYAEKIHVVTEEYPPYNYMDASKKISGVSTEVVENVLKRANQDYQLSLYPWARSYKMAQEEPNVLIYSIGRTEKRESMFKWVDVIAPYDIYLFKLKKRSDIKISSLEDVKHFSVGAVRDDVRAQYLAGLGIKTELVTDDVMNIEKITNGRIDLFPMDELGMAALVKKQGGDINNFEKVFKLDSLSSGLYMAFSLQTPDEVVNKCKKALQSMKADGSFDKIKAKYLK